MAGHLLASGVELGVWSRTPEQGRELCERGATRFSSAEQLAQGASALILCVNRTEDVQQVIGSVINALPAGALVVDHSTIAPEAAKAIGSDLGQRGIRFVDAPITGGSMGAKNGQLTIFLGGSEADCDAAKELVKPYTKRAERVGDPGAGQMAKLANQIAVAGSLLGLCECLSFADKAGLNLSQMKEMIGGGAAGSWAFDNYGPKILAGDWSPGFSIKNQRKDFGYCRQAASELGASIPGTVLVDSLLKVLQDQGRGEEATAALYEVLLKDA